MNPRLKTTLAATPLLLLTLAAPAAAQEDAAAKKPAVKVNLVAQNPLFVVHADGPGQLRTRFLATNLGKMLASNEFKDLLKPMLQALEQMKTATADTAPFDVDELEKAIKGYSGRMTAALHIVDKIQHDSPEPPFGFTVILSPDGVTDLKSMCEKCTKLADEKAGEQAFDLEVEGKTFRCVNESGGFEKGKWAATIPFLHQGHAVMCISTNLKESVKLVLNPDQKPRWQATPEHTAKSVGAWVDVARIVGMFEEVLKSKDGEDYADSAPKVALDLSGIRSVNTISNGFRPLGPYVASDMVVEFNGKDRGVLAAMFPKTRTPNPFLNSLPRTTSLAQTFHFDIGTLFTSVKKVWEALDETDAFMPMSWSDIESKFEEEMGFRLKEDFIDHLGAYGILAQEVSQDEDEDVDLYEDPNGTCVAFQVKNPEAFNKRIESILRKFGQHAGRKKEDYKGQTVYRLSPMGVAEVHYAVADRLFLLGWGNKGGSVLRAVLDAERDIKEGKEPAPLSAGLKSRLRNVQPGYVEIGWANMAANLKGIDRIEEQFSMLPIEFPDWLGTVLTTLEKVRPMLKTYHVDEYLSLTRTQGNTVIFQSIW